MKQNNYKAIFKVSIFHSYFENSICNCLSVKIKPSTSFLLKRFGFVVRSTTNGIEFYANSSDVTTLLSYVVKATGLTSFDFELITNNDYFNNFTDLPMDWMGQFSYDSQSALNKQDQNVIRLEPKLTLSVYQPVIGSLCIHFDQFIKNADQTRPIEFTIHYNARATQWQYYIINRGAIHLSNPKIIGKSGIEFEGPQNVTIETGEKAMLFSSNQNLIPLNILPANKFDLIDALLLNDNGEMNKSTIAKTIVKGLPSPAVESVGNLKNEMKLVSSPMYVYV